MSRGGEIATPGRLPLRFGRGRDRAAGGGSRPAAGQATPQPERGRGADLEHPIERQDDARRLLTRVFEDVQAEQTALPFDQPLRSVFNKRGSERERISLKFRDGQIRREASYRDHAR